MKILFYKKPFNRNFSIYDRLEVERIPEILPTGVEVIFSTKQEDLQTADVVIWDLPFLRNEYTKIKKPSGQIWVGWLMESTIVYPWISDVIKLFDLSMTYRLDSDVPIPYFYYSYLDRVRTLPEPKTHNVASFIGSSVNFSKRIEYLDLLMNQIDVNTFGYRKNTHINDRHYQTKQKMSGKYKFILAFENAIQTDWISEKFFDPFMIGSVPIYLGTENIEEYAPGDNCFINANGKSPIELADELKEYINNDTLYARLFDWKTKPLRQGFVDKMEQIRTHFIIRLLDKLNEKGLWPQ